MSDHPKSNKDDNSAEENVPVEEEYSENAVGTSMFDTLSNEYPKASCTFRNQLPPRWQVDIVQIGCKFIYDDGHNDNKGRVVRISGGEEDTLVASYSGCCRSYVVIVQARAFDGTDEKFHFLDTATVEPDYCGGNLTWNLVPEEKLPKSAAISPPTAPFRLVRSS